MLASDDSLRYQEGNDSISMGTLEFRWGVVIGLAGLIWLYLSYYLGMHTSGVAMVQVMALIGFLIQVVGFVFALRGIHRSYPEMTFREGGASGIRIAGIVAVIAVMTQLGYFFIIHPEWTEYMVEETTAYYEAQGVTGEDLEEYREGAMTTFGLRSYLLQSALGALLVGAITTLITMAVLKGRAR